MNMSSTCLVGCQRTSMPQGPAPPSLTLPSLWCSNKNISINLNLQQTFSWPCSQEEKFSVVVTHGSSITSDLHNLSMHTCIHRIQLSQLTGLSVPFVVEPLTTTDVLIENKNGSVSFLLRIAALFVRGHLIQHWHRHQTLSISQRAASDSHDTNEAENPVVTVEATIQLIIQCFFFSPLSLHPSSPDKPPRPPHAAPVTFLPCQLDIPVSTSPHTATRGAPGSPFQPFRKCPCSTSQLLVLHVQECKPLS